VAFFQKLRGTIESLFALGLGGPQIKASGGAVEARDPTDSGFAIARGLSPIAPNDLAAKLYVDLDGDPMAPSATYANTLIDGRVSQERWTRTIDATLLKSADYTYANGRVATEVRKVFAADGVTIVGQVTITYGYSGSAVTSETIVRDV
jgi:hypothetical protein